MDAKHMALRDFQVEGNVADLTIEPRALLDLLCAAVSWTLPKAIPRKLKGASNGILKL